MCPDDHRPLHPSWHVRRGGNLFSASSLDARNVTHTVPGRNGSNEKRYSPALSYSLHFTALQPQSGASLFSCHRIHNLEKPLFTKEKQRTTRPQLAILHPYCVHHGTAFKLDETTRPTIRPRTAHLRFSCCIIECGEWHTPIAAVESVDRVYGCNG